MARLQPSPFGEDFLQHIVSFRLPGGPPTPVPEGPFAVIYFVRFHDKGPAFDSQTVVGATSSSSDYKFPTSRNIIDPFPAYNIPGVGAPPPAKGPSPPVTNAFSKAMRQTYHSWIGQDKDIRDSGTPADRDHQGYMVLNLSKHVLTSNIDFTITHNNSGVALSGVTSLFMATYRKASSVVYRNQFIPPDHTWDGVTIQTPTGPSFMGYTEEGRIQPVGSVDFASKEEGSPAGIRQWVVSIDPVSLLFSLTGPGTDP